MEERSRCVDGKLHSSAQNAEFQERALQGQSNFYFQKQKDSMLVWKAQTFFSLQTHSAPNHIELAFTKKMKMKIIEKILKMSLPMAERRARSLEGWQEMGQFPSSLPHL